MSARLQSSSFPLSFSQSGQPRLHPFWIPLRGDPRFEKLLEKSRSRLGCNRCRAFDSFAPAHSASGLPVYVARRPAAPFCETL